MDFFFAPGRHLGLTQMPGRHLGLTQKSRIFFPPFSRRCLAATAGPALRGRCVGFSFLNIKPFPPSGCTAAILAEFTLAGWGEMAAEV